MAGNTWGERFTVTTFGESHGPAIGCIVDGCPPGIEISEADLQADLDRRKPGTSRYVTQRREDDCARIVSGVFEGRTTGTPIGLIIENTDQRSRDYSKIKDVFRPNHADYAYLQKYGIRDYRGGGRSSARETATRVAAGAIARKVLAERFGVRIQGYLAAMGPLTLACEDLDAANHNPFFCAEPTRLEELENYINALRKDGDSIGARINVVATGVPPGWGEPVFDRLDAEMSENAVLEKIGERIGQFELSRVVIEGHTDAVGDASYNLALSDRRAETVALALTEYFDVPPANLVTQGYGESQLRVPTNGPEPANRRAVVRNITGLLR